MKIITENIDTDLLVRGVKGVNRPRHAFYRAAVAVRIPGSQCGYYLPTSTGRIWNPLPAITIKHVITHVIHDLDALDIRINVQGVLDNPQHFVPAGVVVHAAGGIDDENDVFAIHRYPAYGIVNRCRTVGQQPLHFLGQALPGDGEPADLIGGVIR